jgi:hypothetical protein
MVAPFSGASSPIDAHDASNAFADARGTQIWASGYEDSESPVSAVSATPTHGKAVSDNAGDASLPVVESAGQATLSETRSSPDVANTPVRGEVPVATSAGSRHVSANALTDLGTVTYQADALAMTTSSPSESRPKVEPDKSARGSEAVNELAAGGKARQASPVIDERAEIRSPANNNEVPRHQTPDSKNDPRNVQLAPRQTTAVDSHHSAAANPASISQPANGKASVSASSPDSGSDKPVGPAPRVARPAEPSASPQPMRSVPAKPWPVERMPMHGDSARSGTPQRSPEIRREAPRVQIGQIDVIVESAAQSVRKSAPASAPTDMASRHYLRRL